MYFDLLVLDAYYELDEIIEEPFDDAEFGSNEEQENGLEVLLKEVAAKCNTLIRNWLLEKKPNQEPREKLAHACKVWKKGLKNFKEFTDVSNAKRTNEIGPHYQDGVGAEEDVKKDNGNDKNKVFIYETRISKMDDRPLRIIRKAAITGYMSGINDPNKEHEVK
ncbi:hypothetical protein F8M41_002454 [Gigaspora margarita]|uniref:Uncharacterized protein n=1 Tax=Gigaspora margarita TaxID=4874 RepID=A0A8H3XDI9_GIGMA|nr:hypothetical protein F8M41_002454 [Gigaspora margarita]